MKDFIRLKSVAHEGKKLVYRFESSLRFFDRHEFYVLYERDFPKPSAGILAVPFASIMASLSWMTGADLEMEVLDEAYAHSFKPAREYFHKWFSNKWSFAGDLKTATEKNMGSAVRDGVLYSGGLDALTTYIRHKEQKPLLFSFFGADIPLDQKKLVDACRKSFDEFARVEGVELCRIESDLWTLFKHDRLKKWTNNWWAEASHAMVMGALTAPYSYKELRRLYIASSHPVGSIDYGWGSDYDLDSYLRWGSTRLDHDFHEVTRFQKMQYFRTHPEYHRFLRVCFTWWKWTGETINCSVCEKCYRSICELLLNGIDPRDCNFVMTDKTFGDMRTAMEKPLAYYSYFGGVPAAVGFWKDIRKTAGTAERGLDLYGSRSFFDWLAGFDRLEKMKDTPAGRFAYSVQKMRWDLQRRLSR